MSDSIDETLINNPNPIDPFDESAPNHREYKSIFENLQGGIIKNYGRKYALYIFIQFTKDKDDVKRWIQKEIAGKVTSTWKQLKDTKAYRIARASMSQQSSGPQPYDGELCINFFLSYSGYQFLDLNLEKIDDVDKLFKDGMKEDWEETYRLKKPPNEDWYNPPEKWDIGKEQVHALILLAHDNLETLKTETGTTITTVQAVGKVLACEAGCVVKNENGMSVGPFGFVDGISQPLFLEADYCKYKHCDNQDINLWDPKASLNLVLVKDPFGGKYGYGSYCVFQKLETNYKLFQKKIGELVEELGEQDYERAAALVIGRFKDGTPIALSKEPNQISNSFDYVGDHKGIKCPLHAHIRKVNPRKDEYSTAENRRTKVRIFRAGITYFNDKEEKQTTDLEISQICSNKLNYLNQVSQQTLEDSIEKISGLLFVCFQRSISGQFAKLQKEWADEAKFPRVSDGGPAQYLDPVIGHFVRKRKEDPKDYPKEQKWPKQDGESGKYLFHGCVKLKGGEYFFAPSIGFLKTLI